MHVSWTVTESRGAALVEETQDLMNERVPCEARRSAEAIGALANWIVCLLVTLTFPPLFALCGHLIFLLYASGMILTLVVISASMVHTK